MWPSSARGQKPACFPAAELVQERGVRLQQRQALPGMRAGTGPAGKARSGAAGRGGVGWHFGCRRGGYLSGQVYGQGFGNFFLLHEMHLK